MGATGRTEHGARASERLAVIIAGPTASGKSALALALAQRLGGTVINADAMQCYSELRIVTARPTPEDERLVPHRLYGVRKAAEPANAAWWRQAALREMEACTLPILCGGTGMYFAALVKGIAAVPDVPEAARAEARRLLAEQGAAAVHARLDPATAARLKPGDSQRVARAYEVLLGTGRGLASWQAETTQPLTGWRTRMILLDPPREVLRAAIAARFAAMLAAGAVDEVRALLAQNLAPDLPLLRAHGVPEIAAMLRGELSQEEAARRAILATHQYTKRQTTWFKHQKLTDSAGMQIIQSRIDEFTQLSERKLGDLDNFLKSAG